MALLCRSVRTGLSRPCSTRLAAVVPETAGRLWKQQVGCGNSRKAMETAGKGCYQQVGIRSKQQARRFVASGKLRKQQEGSETARRISK